MKNIKGKVVIVTGASSGIGESTAIALARQGAKVVLAARRTERIQELANCIIVAGGEAVYLKTDVTKRSDLVELISFGKSKFGRVDVLVNNAGIAHLSRLDALEVEDWEEMIDINLKGVLFGIAAVMPVFKAQGSGHIINIISTAGIQIVPLMAVYAGTKNAVRTITEAMRQESAGQYRVTGISPGFVKTELANHMKDSAIQAAIRDRSTKIAISPEDIASAVVYAVSQPGHVDVGDIVIRPTIQD
ncbi:SDR family oxidoreductase [Pedobacter duraquae]|uniref:NADP-dependent 3-hydroxy acid dehydrogenase YdfG n=1 Tax=Pedobacter duraquae TaxID=425511 RepID=A0A4V3C3Y1_9SPHI|nr:SDR family oxidoreductase [Pedobacter duraquae]TDO23858.1 NADP-dependent 3-hydroxy acid dehydrogenase YdfG [Pedobacter duraquae]